MGDSDRVSLAVQSGSAEGNEPALNPITAAGVGVGVLVGVAVGVGRTVAPAQEAIKRNATTE